MSLTKLKQPTYEDGRTKQAFKDETDINKLLHRAQKTGTISHLNKHEARYGDFSNFDFFAAQVQLAQGQSIFDDLPSELRNEFNESPREFFTFVNDPANKDKLAEILPGLAEPGRQNISINNNIGADGEAAAAAAAQPATPAPTPTPAVAPTTPLPTAQAAATPANVNET